MRKTVAAAVALAFATPAGAAVEPTPIASDPRVVQIKGACEVGRSDCFVEGEPIVLRGKVGNTLRVIFPQGWVVNTLAPSDEHIIRQIPIEREARRGRRNSDAPNEGPVTPPEPDKDEGRKDSVCTLTDSLSLCVTRDRFLDVMPSIAQSEQSFPLLLLFRTKGKSDFELNVDFVLSTVPDPEPEPEKEDAEPGASMVRRASTDGGQAKKEPPPPPPPHFHTVHVRLPAPAMPQAAPQKPAQGVSRSPGRAIAPAPVPPPVAPRNSAYAPYGSLGNQP